MSDLMIRMGIAASADPDSPCPECRGRLIDRVGGVWCPRCKGWVLVYVKPGGERGRFVKNAVL